MGGGVLHSIQFLLTWICACLLRCFFTNFAIAMGGFSSLEVPDLRSQIAVYGQGGCARGCPGA